MGVQSSDSSGGNDPDPTAETSAGEAAEGATDGTDAESQAEGSRVLDAELLPSFRRSRDNRATITVDIYVVTGRHGILSVPESFCRECHMFTRRAEAAAEQIEADVDVRVFSWWTRFLGALRYGGYHPPVMVVGGKRLCQGHDVPTTDEVVAALEAAIDRKDRE